MSYIDFKTSVQLPYHVKIEGWPEDVAFGPPCDMVMTDVRKVRAALNDGTCRFIKMSKKEVEELSKEKAVRKVRAQRSDKGKEKAVYKKRGRRGDRDDESENNEENNNRPHKRARRDTVAGPSNISPRMFQPIPTASNQGAEIFNS